MATIGLWLFVGSGCCVVAIGHDVDGWDNSYDRSNAADVHGKNGLQSVAQQGEDKNQVGYSLQNFFSRH
jgi:hypothetical protein